MNLLGWIHVWMADKPAGSVEQSQQICLFTVRQCGTTAMTTGAGLDIYLVCWLMSLNHLNTLGGIFHHLPLSSEYSVSPMHVCVLYKHCGLSRTRPGRSVEGGSLQFGLFLFLKKPVLWTVCWPKHNWQTCLLLPLFLDYFCVTLLQCGGSESPTPAATKTVKTSKASGRKTQPCSACLGWFLSQW